MPLYKDLGYDDYLNINTLEQGITSTNVYKKIADSAIDNSRLNPNIIIKSLRTSYNSGKYSDRTNAYIKIEGNNIYLIDNSTGGSDPITGDSATIFFQRSDNNNALDPDFIIRRRKGINDTDENVMELFYENDPKNSGGRNYVFLGIEGSETDTAADHHTDIIQIQADEGFNVLLSTDAPYGNGGIVYRNNKYPDSSSFDDGITVLALGFRGYDGDTYWNGGGYLALGGYTLTGSEFGAYQFMDSGGWWAATDLLPYTSGLINLGNNSYYFNEVHCASVVDHSYVDLPNINALEAINKIKVSDKKDKKGFNYLDKLSFPECAIIKDKDGDNHGISQSYLISILLKSIKELNNKIDNLEQEINKLKK